MAFWLPGAASQSSTPPCAATCRGPWQRHWALRPRAAESGSGGMPRGGGSIGTLARTGKGEDGENPMKIP